MSTTTGYSRSQIALHWLTAIGVVIAFLSHEGMEDAFETLRDTGGSPHPTIHSVAGITVFWLVLIRLWLRRRNAPEPEGEGLAQTAAIWGHRLLYLLLLAVPLGGFLTWIVGIHALDDLHGSAGQALMVVALGHALMAFYHHYVKKDGTLRRMIKPQ
ncbi:cytochrome b/b6 domain-containing protein [Ponticoccus sp. SC2-23]|uniref:cytochrome b n=1 Tax=Alexandriicola marinus TaxID=2081710 RepID=UPI000FD89466|nr:cytochrome b/b6 domain-containing protein [Alexandriicola marinus]MBM1221171.1 cytochrome b/b6 domain-containing protein [Ponticoccus sp. SC6-9]MBM1225741.1 cytochrome b/b6 domain-containing protein [Ponticoccus sp. SC6-15]MBM1227893.1 cytochrome b/b6 domain-containing protein [Ponticoccus sp. SC6-38]MBM1234469.1 cytochrome b/b6 domain-containing protein [Ponticoccus sp. SC6-45]MBM1238395.1 cytochrome b/b6 domain-containing protein [Ponticoccus sp. SC6-49]MBM1243664.1 cytochrome b/b6 domai